MPDFSNPLIWIGIVLVVVVLFGEPLWAGGKKFVAWWNTSKPTEPIETADPDVADMLAWKRLEARFKRNECKEGLAALDECWRHFNHTGGA